MFDPTLSVVSSASKAVEKLRPHDVFMSPADGWVETVFVWDYDDGSISVEVLILGDDLDAEEGDDSRFELDYSNRNERVVLRGAK